MIEFTESWRKADYDDKQDAGKKSASGHKTAFLPREGGRAPARTRTPRKCKKPFAL